MERTNVSVMRKAKAAVLYGIEDIRIAEFSIPEIQEDDALMRVEACGLCGTDHELFTGHIKATYPMIPGHESVGVIEQIGEKAAERWGVSKGDRVALECWQSCRRCDACAQGIYRRCGVHGQTDLYGMIPTDRIPALYGGYATHHYLSPDSLVLPVPSGLSAVDATLFNPLGAGIKWGVEIPQTKNGDVVAILGPGIRGLCAAFAAREAGAGFIMVTGHGANDHDRLQMAMELGADLVVDVSEESPSRKLREATEGRLADVVVDVTANSPSAFAQAVQLAAVNATIVVAGMKGARGVPDLHTDAIVWKELTIKGALGVDAPVYRQALDILATKRFPFDVLSREEVPLEEAGGLLSRMAGIDKVAAPVHGVIVPS
ncbi:MAG: zinc-dependent alcohol dehydrogenase [Actinomycetota bacterium]